MQDLEEATGTMPEDAPEPGTDNSSSMEDYIASNFEEELRTEQQESGETSPATAATATATAPALKQPGLERKLEFIVGKVKGKFYRFSTITNVPTDTVATTSETVTQMTTADVGILYGEIAKVPTKKFKDKKVATESLVYQIAKLPFFDPDAAPSFLGAALAKSKSAQPTAASAATTGASTSKSGATPKTAGALELCQVPDLAAALTGLAPQAKELILIMAEIVKEKGSTKFSDDDVAAKLAIPEIAAKLHTKQEPIRIFKYYKGRLADAGFIKVG